MTESDDPREERLRQLTQEAAEADRERRRLHGLWQAACQRYVDLTRMKTEVWRDLVGGRV